MTDPFKYYLPLSEAFVAAAQMDMSVVVICENERAKHNMRFEIRTMLSVQDYNFPRQQTGPFCFLHGRLRIVSPSNIPALYGLRFNWWTGEFDSRLRSWILSSVVTP